MERSIPAETDTRQNIIEAAREIFARYGFRKATMDDIARAARKAKSSLYHYFKSKEEVFREVVEQEAAEVKAEISRAVAAAETPQKKFRAYVLTRMTAFKRVANLFSAFKDEYLESYSFIERLRENYNRYEIETITGILQEGLEMGAFIVKNLELTAYAIFTAAKGLEYSWALESDMKKIETNIDSLLDILFHGLVRR
ncbi:MAG: TetR/AcrR family transcriptional regulator [Firmicutes bacterium]|jgi:AcrR family transcriptional regulator|nr:TetR/AcrR family transcriptional regulator [Bacillota bacterium]